MKHRIALCVGLTALGVAGRDAGAGAAVYAEPPPGYGGPPQPMVHGGLPPNEILMVARASGLRPLTQPARQGPQNYVLLASDNMGGQLRVVVNAHTGRIVHAAPAHDPRFAYASRCARAGSFRSRRHSTRPRRRRHGAPAARLEEPDAAAAAHRAHHAAAAANAAGGRCVAEEQSCGRAATSPARCRRDRRARRCRARGRRSPPTRRAPAPRRHATSAVDAARGHAEAAGRETSPEAEQPAPRRRRAPRPPRRRRPKRRWSRSRRWTSASVDPDGVAQALRNTSAK